MPEDMSLAEAYVDLVVRNGEFNVQLEEAKWKLRDLTNTMPDVDTLNKAAGSAQQFGSELETPKVNLRAMAGMLSIIDPKLGEIARSAQKASRGIGGIGAAAAGSSAQGSAMVGRFMGLGTIAVMAGLAIAKLVDLVYWYGLVSKADRDRANNAEGIGKAEMARQAKSIAFLEKQIEQHKILRDLNRSSADIQEDVATARANVDREPELLEIAKAKLQMERDMRAAREATSQVAMPETTAEARENAYEDQRRALLERYTQFQEVKVAEMNARLAKKQTQAQKEELDLKWQMAQDFERRDKAEKERNRQLAEFEEDKTFREALKKLEDEAKAKKKAAEAGKVESIGSAQELVAQIQSGPAELAARKTEELAATAKEQLLVQRQQLEEARKYRAITAE